MPYLVRLSLIALIVTAAPTAVAQESADRASSPRDQYYVFDDDPLDAVGMTERGARVRTRREAGRVTLIRPRTHFVRELTRSVENL